MIYKRSKYRAVKTNGYDSKREARYASQLHLLQQAGEITNLEEQKRFELLPKQTDSNGKCIFRAIYYVADFCFYDKEGKYHVQDVKGLKTDVFSLKEKLFYHRYHFPIEIVR